MLRKSLVPIAILLAVIGLFCGWVYSFKEDQLMISTGVNVLQIFAGTISFAWLFQAFQAAEKQEKPFWLLLQAGVVLYTTSILMWLYIQLAGETQGLVILFSAVGLTAYLLFLCALIFKIRKMSSESSGPSYLFNILIFVIIVASISFHYLISPTLESSGEAWWTDMMTVSYAVVDLTILFVIIILYFLIRKNKKQQVLLFLGLGLLIQITADVFYSYGSVSGSYQTGHFADLMWLSATLFIGFTGYYTKFNDRSSVWIFRNPVEDKDAAFPFASITVFIILVIHSYHYAFNALSLGFLITFILVVGRQLQLLRKNQQLVAQYRYLAYHDPLTDLRNRSSFTEEIENLLADYPDKQYALLLIDLDQFKLVNDTLGHHIGDLVLVETAKRLEMAMEENMLLFRLGGDEFIVAILDAADEKCVQVANGILGRFRESLTVEGYEVHITPSIGISKYPEHGSTLEDLMKDADAAMYLSKENGKNGYSFFNVELSEEKSRKMMIENALKKAVQKNQFVLYYQPKVELRTNKIIGMEALLRWQHPELGWISPVEFIPVAEETGQIVSIGEWVLEEACRQNKQWQDAGYSPLNVSVNVSVLQFKHGKFLETVQQVLDKTALDTQYLELEITESIMQNIKESKKILESLQQLGIKISIDDFGTGYSSLHVLQKLPIDTLKIDKSFVDELDLDASNTMVKAIIDLGLNLNMTLVAEGIESENQMRVLIEHGCTIGQGYLFSKPVAPEDFEELMKVTELLKGKIAQSNMR